MIPAGNLPSGSEVERFRAFVSRRFGLRLEEGHVSALAELLRRRAGGAGRSVELYLDELESPAASSGSSARDGEMRTIAAELTIGETYFFRDTEQLRAFREAALPDRAQARAASRRLRILSAACATGEEPYSLAILARDFVGTIGWDPSSVSVTAFDLNVRSLERAAAARYTTWALRETSDELKARHFRDEGRTFVLDPAARAAVSFHERNLALPDDSFWRPDSFDVVFCRNVIMYFTPETAAAVIARIARSLSPDGFLFLGYAETLRDLSRDFHLRHTHGAFYYQRREDYRARDDAGAPFGAGAMPPPPIATLDRVLAQSARPDGRDTSWIDAIGRASERIRSLTSPAPSEPPSAPVVAPARDARRDLVDARSGDRPSDLARDLAGNGALEPPAARPLDRGVDLAAAVELVRQERFAEAATALAALPPESAGAADVLLLRAVLLTNGGDLAGAEALCARVLELDELSAGAHYLTALRREDAGDRRGAVEHDQVAVYLDPTFAMPRLHLGLLARRGGDAEGARRELGAALGLLQREDGARLLLYAGGFNREALVTICRAELASCGGAP